MTSDVADATATVADLSSVVAEVVALGSDASVLSDELANTKIREESLKKSIEAALGVVDSEELRTTQRKYDRAIEEVLQEMPGLYKVVETGAARLDSRISQTRSMADDVSRKVRELDLSRTRALQALEMVQSIVDLRSCVHGAEAAIEEQQFEKAATYIYEYREKELVRAKKFKEHSKPKLASSRRSDEVLQISGTQESLRVCEKKLQEKVLEKLDVSVEHRNDEQVLSCCSIFARLGRKQEGVSRFMQYQCSKLRADLELEIELSDAIGSETSSRRNSVESSYKPKSYVDLITYLFNKVAANIQQLSNVGVKHFGKEKVFQVTILSSLHQECDTLACRVLNLFLSKRRVKEKVQIVLSAATSEEIAESLHRAMTLGMSVYDADQTDSMIALDISLDEIALMSQHTVSYDRYAKSRAMRIAAAPKVDGDVSEDESTTTLNSILEETNEYDGVLQEMAGLYAIMEEKFMRYAVLRAIEQEIIQDFEKTLGSDSQEVPEDTQEESSLVAGSSVVADTFYIMQKSSQRALATANVDSACATVNNIVKILEEELGKFLGKRCSALPSEATTLSQQGQAHFERIRGTVMTDSAVPESEEMQQLVAPHIILNSCALCLHYTTALQEQVETEAEEALSTEAEKNKLKNCIDNLVETVNFFHRTLDSALSTFTSTLKSPIQTQVTSSTTSLSFDLEEADFHRVQAIDPSIRPLLATVDTVLEISAQLSDSVAIAVTERVATFTADALEAAYVRKKFSLYGALLLERDVRRIVLYFTRTIGATKAKKTFRRLVQLSRLLSCEQVEDVYEVYENEIQGFAVKGLSLGEIKRVLALRKEFLPSEIQKLNLQ